MKQIAFLFVALLAVSLSFAQDGPFGISMGDLPGQHGCALYEDEDFVYTCDEIAKLHPDIEHYVVWSSEETGVFFVRGIGYENENDKYGVSVKEVVEKIANQLTIKYGKWTDHIDDIAHTSIWTDPDEWAEAVSVDERVYIYRWKSVSENDIIDIALYADAIYVNDYNMAETTYLVLEFRFSNAERFEEIQNNKGADVF